MRPDHFRDFCGMIDFVRNGGFWTDENIRKHDDSSLNLIQISRFPDNVLMIHDGHHRAVATWLSGRTELREDEFYIQDWNYEDYDDINFDSGYLTPFDPRKEVRLCDLSEWKILVKDLQKGDIVDDSLNFFIRSAKASFCRKRKIWTVPDLAIKWNPSKVLKDMFAQPI